MDITPMSDTESDSDMGSDDGCAEWQRKYRGFAPRICIVDGIARRGGIWASMPLFDNRMVHDRSENTALAFRICRTVPGIIAAGGSVARAMDPALNGDHPKISTTDSLSDDVDLYVRANDGPTARAIVARLLETIRPVGDVVMTRFAMSFDVEMRRFDSDVMLEKNNVRTYSEDDDPPGTAVCRVQVISRPIPDTDNLRQDVEGALENYDLSCCKFATDGREVFCTPDALVAMYETRIVRVHWSRVLPERLAKYQRRGYDFEIIGPGDAPLLDIDPHGAGMAAVAGAMRTAPPIFETRREMDFYQVGDPDDGYGRTNGLTRMIRNGRCTLDLSLKRYRDGVQDFMIRAICGVASRDTQHMMREGTTPPEYLADWKSLACNAFCDDLLATTPWPSDEEYDRLTAGFADDLDGFMAIVQNGGLHVPVPFYDGPDPSSAFPRHMEPPDTDFDEFRRRWCVPAPASASGTRDLSTEEDEFGCATKRRSVESPPSPPRAAMNCSRDELEFVVNHHFQLWGAHDVTIFFPALAPSASSSVVDGPLMRRFAISVPDMTMVFGIIGPTDVPDRITARCDFGVGWEARRDLREFRRTVDAVDDRCTAAIPGYHLDKKIESHRGYAGMYHPIRPTIDKRRDMPTRSLRPPSFVVHIRDEHSTIAMKGPDGALTSYAGPYVHHVGTFALTEGQMRLEFIHHRIIDDPNIRHVTIAHWTLISGILEKLEI